MQRDPRYDDVVHDVGDFLVAKAERARAQGVTEVWIDPGIGFGKTAAHNLALLRHLDLLVGLGYPVLVGTSRKSFLSRLDPDEDLDVEDRAEVSLATATWAMSRGAAMVRVHDVVGAAQAARLVDAVGTRSP
jgi:dihydropteroate synthase